MLITTSVLASIRRKNKRAQKRMARRCQLKVDARNRKDFGDQALYTRYTALEIELQRIEHAYGRKELKRRDKIQ